ncbi:unnamed protein product [Polarella glacialis]|uniref:Uncharacterized protein n=1 Tax=Polarella glacialis TaxID=89957 RepID=A0A813FZP6_POLGL|nr:unnamed protein product [Polarella glacialis]
MDLESAYPDHLHLREYLGNFSNHSNVANYTFPKTQGKQSGRPLPMTKTSADHLAPGHYAVDRDFPGKRRSEDMPVGFLTRSANSHKFIFGHEDRAQSFLRTLTSVKNPGPGAYHEGTGPGAGARSQEIVQPSWTVPQVNKVGGRPLPRTKSGAEHLGPGCYQLPSKFTQLSWRKQMVMDKASKNNKDTWAGPQYSQVFARIKPGPKALTKVSSAPALSATM